MLDFLKRIFCKELYGQLLDSQLECIRKGQDINALKETIHQKELEYAKLMEQKEGDNSLVQELNDQISELKTELALLEAANDQAIKLAEFEKIWDSNHTKSLITYQGRTFPNSKNYISVPLQVFVTPGDPVIMKDIIKYNLKIIDPVNCNDQILNIYKFTRTNPSNPYRYKYDEATIGFPEFWMFPFELRNAGAGDCDDWGIELASYLIAAGLPSFRVRCVAGNCRGYDGAGHLTVYVLADDMKTWYHLNSTTPISMITAKKLTELPDAKDKNDLIGIASVWFSFNDKNAWSDFEGSKTDAAKLVTAGIIIEGFKFECM